MQINSISQSQPQFKGLFILKNVQRNCSMAVEPLIAKSVEGCSFKPLADKIENATGNLYKTLFISADKEEFVLNVPFDKVLEAYERVAFTNKTEEINNSLYSNSGAPFFG